MPDWFTPLLLLLDAAAVYRLTRLVTTDHWPLGWWRQHLREQHPTSPLTTWVHCPWCTSVWIAPVVLGLQALAPRAWPYAAAVLAFSAITGLAATWENN
ncbi:MAG: DUF1360 domain-containing protein [Pseudonocardiaceae bacterium]